ncbi:MAG: arylsulfatase [Isosphaeraceae bacterium]|nr:arylsulfatase [Isosphaeraceae bacterium]
MDGRGVVLALAVGILGSLGAETAAVAAVRKAKRPNVVLIMSDDQGYGDLGSHGNPVIKTPNLDRLARQGVQLTRFHVCPVCSPTRASLLTGRYNYRTRVVDTYLGRSMMDPAEVTLAEMLAAAGYRTGIFGKWHLGDNYPLRPIDQGFQEALVHKGGGIGQPSDPPGGGSYFDPLLQHNGQTVATQGYCSDVYTDAALRFIEQDRERPFFVYLAFNAPHAPLQVPKKYLKMYDSLDLSPAAFPRVGQPLPAKLDHDMIARVYGMVTNLDDNIGRLLARLDALGLAEETIVVFLTDNGPQQARYNAGMRGRKGSVYEGGIHVPCFIRWTGKIPEGRQVDRIAAHIDLAPTLLELCDVGAPKGVQLDGRSLVPLLGIEAQAGTWPDRTLYFQWHRGDVPGLGRACAALEQRWKLVQPAGAAPERAAASDRYELYDLEADPYEQHDVAAEHPEIVERLRKGYEAWFRDVSATRGYDPPRIVLGTSHENPSVLTRQDWRGPKAGWTPESLGFWEVQVGAAGNYRITLHIAPAPTARTARVRFRGVERAAPVADGATSITIGPLHLEPGPGRLEAWVEAEPEGGKPIGVQFAEVERID